MMWVRNARKLSLMVGLLVAALPASSSETLVPGVVADGETLFMMNSSGGIDALSTVSGSILWSSTAAAKPLALHGDVLVSQVDSARSGLLEVVVQRKDTGAVNHRMNISVPAQVWAQVNALLGRKFIARGGVRDGEMYLVWEQSLKAVRGAAPPPGQNTPPQVLSAAHRLNLLANTYQTADVTILNRSLPTLPESMQQMFEQGELSGQPFFTGQTLAGTTASSPDGQVPLKLLRWNAETGERLPDVVLASDAYVMYLPSADQKHLLVSKRTASGTWEEYKWSIFDLDSGERLGEIQDHFSHAHFYVHETTLVHEARAYGRNQNGQWVEVPRQLRAVLLTGGTEVWTRPLRDLTYRGQVPP